MKKFGLIGVAGFVAPRHLQAISEVGGELLAATDPHDSVGILDRYFPQARYFSEIERFDRFLEKCRRDKRGVDYLSICSPNYLHDAHVRLALRLHADAICEKPLVISPWNLDALAELEAEYQRKIHCVLQLRLLPELRALKQEMLAYQGERRRVTLRYITRRGNWYHASWKGDESRSGGLAMNIGVHFFDLLLWLFGAVEESRLEQVSPTTLRGQLVLRHADVDWLLSVDERELPEAARAAGEPAYRSLTLDGRELSLSGSDLHLEVYREILAGRGHGVEDARPAIEFLHRLRTTSGSQG